MKLTNYIKTSEDFHLISGAYEIIVSRALLRAAKERRDMIRTNLESEPKRSDELKHDLVYNLGVIAGLNFIIDLPGKAAENIKNLPEGELE